MMAEAGTEHDKPNKAKGLDPGPWTLMIHIHVLGSRTYSNHEPNEPHSDESIPSGNEYKGLSAAVTWRHIHESCEHRCLVLER